MNFDENVNLETMSISDDEIILIGTSETFQIIIDVRIFASVEITCKLLYIFFKSIRVQTDMKHPGLAA